MTKKQLANIAQFKKGGTKVSMRLRRTLGMPSGSWWLTPGINLGQRAKEEETRMRHSQFGLPPSEQLKG